ncbi:MAG: nuclear transport factor 2 family protein [Acidimicrobiia bacterium]|nr:nuclear transport factor 2 family protein [Acidimicrobiia bacterium]
MENHPHAQKYRDVHEAFMSGEGPARMLDLLADDVVWHQIGGETLNGKQAVADSWAMLDAGVDFSLELHDVISNGEHLVGLVEASVKAGDESFNYRTAEIAHVNDEGKITERWAFSDDTQAIIDFFGRLG